MCIVFVGKSASQSRIHSCFWPWVRILGGDVGLRTMDVPAGLAPTSYRKIIGSIVHDESVMGCVITDHKVSAYDSSRSMFCNVEPVCDALGVISLISNHGGNLRADAEEPRAILRAIDEICGRRGAWHFPDVVVFGGGGAGRALAYALLQRKPLHKFDRIIVSDICNQRIREFASLSRTWPSHEVLTLAHVVGQSDNDEILRIASPESLIVNATGLGKERSGSPISGKVEFPKQAAVWDFNYRGTLDFLEQARSQIASRRVSAHDGTAFFVSGWLEALSCILSVRPWDSAYTAFQDACTTES